MTAPPPTIAAHAGALLRLALPIAISQLSQMAMALTDSILLGGLGAGALAAGGLGAGLFFTCMVVLQGVQMAASVRLAQASGSGSGGAGSIVASGLLLALLMSLPSVLLLGQVGWLMHRLGEPPAMAHDVGAYLGVLRWGAPGALAGLGLLRAVLPALGAAGLLLRTMPAMAVVNGLLNYGLIHGFSWQGVRLLPRLGFIGSALATTLTLYAASALLVLLLLLRRHLRASLQPFRPLLAECRLLLRLGAPVSLTIAAEVLLFLVAGLMAGLLGPAALAAHQIAQNVASTTFMVPLALSQAANVRVGYWTGAGRPHEARRSGLTAIGLAVLVMGVFSLLLLTLPHVIARAYLDPGRPANAQALRIAVTLLGIVAVFQIADGVQAVALGALRGLGDTAVPMLIASACYWLIGYPLCRLAAFRYGLGVPGLWGGLGCALACVAVIASLRFMRRTRAGAPGVERTA
ncbi:MATE family efflux transporter [Lichenicoccus sp.]|uniref:MATE family efflux transporter n=1 Tax=Lichenicoccus sp. TaxID=2781899 RepID=UPI003D09ED03